MNPSRWVSCGGHDGLETSASGTPGVAGENGAFLPDVPESDPQEESAAAAQPSSGPVIVV
jgi:hypothetical protein